MVRANFTDGNNYTEAPGLTQWDYGQVLEIHGLDLPKAVEIHFAIYDCPDDAIIRIGNTVDKITRAAIPEKIMEQPQDAVAYVYVSDTKSGETVRTVYMPMIPRQKPEAFDAPEDAELFKETIETVNAAADRAELAKSDAETARDVAQSTADETEADRAEVEALKSQAQTAAESALLSEHNAKASETAAQTAQAGAETAEGQAELFAGQAEENKNVVEDAKAVVMELGQKVSDDKSNVEQAVSDFEIARQNAVQEIKDAENAALENIGTGIDDTLTQSGKAADAKETGDKLSKLKDDLSESITEISDAIGYKKITTLNGWSLGNGLWLNYTDSSCELIPVNPTDIIKITRNRNRNAIYAFLKTNIALINYHLADFASGYTKEVAISSFDETTVEVPIDANFLYITTTSSGTDASPSKILINGIDIQTQLIDKFYDLQNEVAVEIDNVMQDINNLKADNPYKKGLTNIITNGNIESMSTWVALNGSGNAINNVLQVIGDGSAFNVRALNTTTFDFSNNGKVFISAKIRVTDDKCSRIVIKSIGGIVADHITRPVANKWYSFGMVAHDRNYAIQRVVDISAEYLNETEANGKVLEIKDVIAFEFEDIKFYELMDIVTINEWWSGYKEVIVRKQYDYQINNKNNGYKLLYRNAYQSVKRPIITFINDDGWVDDYDKLVSISEKHNVPFCTATYKHPSSDGAYALSDWHMWYLQNELGWEFMAHPDNARMTSWGTEEEIHNVIKKTNEYLTDRGLICRNLVYPFGENDERVRRIAKEYYRCAFTTNPNPAINTGVVASFSLHRYPMGYGGDSSTNTLANFKSKVDMAVSNNGWLVFMLHPRAEEHTQELNEIIDELITYIKSLNVDILTADDGYDIFGNALECGDYTGGSNGIAIGFDGSKANI